LTLPSLVSSKLTRSTLTLLKRPVVRRLRGPVDEVQLVLDHPRPGPEVAAHQHLADAHLALLTDAEVGDRQVGPRRARLDLEADLGARPALAPVPVLELHRRALQPFVEHRHADAGGGARIAGDGAARQIVDADGGPDLAEDGRAALAVRPVEGDPDLIEDGALALVDHVADVEGAAVAIGGQHGAGGGARVELGR
jgi:hypothetical protein